VLRTEHNKSLAATIELSLDSPMFQELDPDARALLGVIAFFPQGVDEDNIGWLFPTISNGASTFNKFCILSLTYRSNGFITMLAPLRDYLSPKDPKSSPLLCTTKECYFTRMSVDHDPDKPGPGEARWITSEDVNVEHLLDIFTSIDANSVDVWEACTGFTWHLAWHKRRPTVLRPKIEGLADDHPSKPKCLYQLAQLLEAVGSPAERRQLLIHTLKLERERGNDRRVARTLRTLSDANRLMGLRKEGIRLIQEALEIFERLGDTVEQAWCLNYLAWLLFSERLFSAAEEAASRSIKLLPEKGEEFLVCESHHVLGSAYCFKRKWRKAIHHFEVALGIASSLNLNHSLFWLHLSLADLLSTEGKFDDAHAHIGRAMSYAADIPYYQGRGMEHQAMVFYKQHRLEEARPWVLRALDVFEKLGAAKNLESCREFFQWIEEEMNNPVALYFDGELLEMVLLPTPTDSLSSQVSDGTISHVCSDIPFISGATSGEP